jgi:hypothetical protein
MEGAGGNTGPFLLSRMEYMPGMADELGKEGRDFVIRDTMIQTNALGTIVASMIGIINEHNPALGGEIKRMLVAMLQASTEDNDPEYSESYNRMLNHVLVCIDTFDDADAKRFKPELVVDNTKDLT